MGAVHLTVADLGRSIRYYKEQIGSRWSHRTSAWLRSAPPATACWC
jgi:catechol-2,3-dioxygenase